MVDVHCHLTDPGFENELETVIANASGSGVGMITNSTSLEDSKKAVIIAEKYEQVWVCAGIHPENSNKIQDLDYEIQQLLEIIDNRKVVGIGEVGLDYFQGINEPEKERQKELLNAQLQIADKAHLPVEIHNRAADNDIWESISKYNLTGLMHCFTRNMEFMEKCVNGGWYISFGGLITYPNNTRMTKVALKVPGSKLLLETDSPFSYPEFGVKLKNQPQNVKIVARTIAKLMQKTDEEIDNLTTNNAYQLFKRMV